MKPTDGSQTAGAQRGGRDRSPHTVPEPTVSEHPVVTSIRAHRAGDAQLRLADSITRWAGSMPFVYLHIVVFATWMILAEPSPWPSLTLVVSLEAIFLSAFVMIGQNRSAVFQQAKADHDFLEEETELKTNTQITREIHALTVELTRRTDLLTDPRLSSPAGSTPTSSTPPG